MPARNPETLVDVPLTCGITLGIIDTSRRTGKPAWLRKPWEYALPIPNIRAFGNAFRPLFNEIAQDRRSPDSFEGPDTAREDYVPPSGELHIWKKPKGVTFHVSITGTSTYTSQKRWSIICDQFQQIITSYLGPDAHAYLKDYEPGYYNRERNERCYELYARFDAEIMYAEYIPIQQASKTLDTLEDLS